MTVHPGAGQREHTLVNALLHHCSTLSGIGGKERPGIVHRLDKETSGCLVAAKNDLAHRELSKQFTSRTVEKIYLALVAGKLRKATGMIENKIGRHPVHRQRMNVSSRAVARPKLNIEFFIRASRPVWLNANCTVAAHIKFESICIISVILC